MMNFTHEVKLWGLVLAFHSVCSLRLHLVHRSGLGYFLVVRRLIAVESGSERSAFPSRSFRGFPLMLCGVCVVHKTTGGWLICG